MTWSEEHPDALSSLNIKAIIFNKLGRYTDALKLYEHVLLKRRTLLGDEHPETLSTLKNEAKTFAQIGRHQLALKSYDFVIVVYWGRNILKHWKHFSINQSLSVSLDVIIKR